jgi:hypothetical protein
MKNRQHRLAKTVLYLSLLLPLAFLAGCGSTVVYDFEPPADSAGKACVLQCGQERQQCIADVADERNEIDRRYKQCLQDKRLMQHNYEACVDAGGQGCIKPRGCTRDFPQRYKSECKEAHRICYRDCGGRVTSREVD